MCCCVLLRCVQLAGSVGGSVVRGLSGLDAWLEGNKVLPVLKPLEIPDDVKDESGELNAECKEVRWLCCRLCLSCCQSWLWRAVC